MAIGDTVSALTSVADDAYLDVQPGVGAEWIIHNIFCPNDADIELYVSDGTNSVLIDTNTGGYMNTRFHPKNAIYLKIRNVSGVAAYLGYDGVVSK